MKSSSQDRLIQQAKKLYARITSDFVKLGRILTQLRRNNAPLREFKEDLKEIGIGYRKAAYLMNIAAAVDEGHISEAEAVNLGWTKLAYIISQVNQGASWQDSLANARKMSSGSVHYGTDGQQRYAMVFYLTAQEYAAMEKALLQNGALRHATGLRKKAEALMTLMMRAEAVAATKRKFYEAA